MGMKNNHWRILQKHNRHLRHQFVRQFMPYFLLGIFALFTFIFALNSAIDTIINAKIMGEIGKSPTSNAEKQPIFWKNNEFVSYEKERRNLVKVMAVQLNSSKQRKKKVLKRRWPRAIGNESNANCDRMKNLENESAHDSPFPSDLFNIEQRQKGAIILHFFGLIYMFVALAIVCDEYFVPSLGVITEMLDISDDVAGATFMAAGGSAPEFFTSLFGTFITQNNVGVGTIVGSATFNILCVLAFCTIFSRNVLILTWWPLFRDIIFYSLALFLLSIFFFDELVEWPEALAMFIFYLFYAIFMKYNSTIENAVKKRFFAGTRVETKDLQANVSNNNAVNENGIVNGNGTIAVENHSNKTISKSSAEKHEPSPPSVRYQNVGQQQHLQQSLVRNSTPILHAGAHYPQIYPGIVQVALGNRNHFKNEMTLKTDIPRIVRKRESADHIISHHYRSRQQKDESKNENYNRRKRFNKANSLPAFNHLPPMASITPRIIKVMAATSNANSTIGGSIHQPKSLQNNGGLPPVNTITMPMMNIHQGNNLAPIMVISPLGTLKEEKKLEINNIKEQMENDGIYSASTSAVENESTNDASNDDISLVENGEFMNKNKNEEKIKEELAQNEVDGQQPIDLSWPKTFNKQCIFLLMIPIMIPLYYTLPDVKKEERKKYAAITFIGSVLWIAFFTYLMVWWASVIGQTLGLPTEVIGLTILAAGTSIPDLITSVIVSRKGLADMAVSSSIGSNLFDICVGLPLPWLLHYIISATQSAIGNDSISVKSNGLMCSIGILFMMLIVLIVSVAISKWKMDKLFGTIMLIAYILFCIFSILLEKKIIICPLKIVSKC